MNSFLTWLEQALSQPIAAPINVITYAVPVFVALILIEIAWARRHALRLMRRRTCAPRCCSALAARSKARWSAERSMPPRCGSTITGWRQCLRMVGMACHAGAR